MEVDKDVTNRNNIVCGIVSQKDFFYIKVTVYEFDFNRVKDL